jgi:hypothetical protein
LVGLFHIPPTYTAQERQQEFHALQSLFDIVYDELGAPRDFRIPTVPTSTLTFSVGSGDFVYWQEHREVLAFTYGVRFARAGPGQVIIRLCRISSESEWQIRDIGFGLSTQAPDAKIRIQRIASQAARTLGLQKPRGVSHPKT